MAFKTIMVKLIGEINQVSKHTYIQVLDFKNHFQTEISDRI